MEVDERTKAIVFASKLMSVDEFIKKLMEDWENEPNKEMYLTDEE